MEQTNKGLSGNQLKLFAMLAMTVDHFTSVIWPDYPRDWWILAAAHHRPHGRADLLVHGGRGLPLHPRSEKVRRTASALCRHRALRLQFCLRHPLCPAQNRRIQPDQRDVAAVSRRRRPLHGGAARLKQWQKTLAVVALTLLAFPGDWSSIAVLAILEIGQNRGDFRRQMTRMMLWVAMYALIYALFIDPAYGILQLLRRADHSAAQALQRHARRGLGHEISFLSLLSRAPLPLRPCPHPALRQRRRDGRRTVRQYRQKGSSHTKRMGAPLFTFQNATCMNSATQQRMMASGHIDVAPHAVPEVAALLACCRC